VKVALRLACLGPLVLACHRDQALPEPPAASSSPAPPLPPAPAPPILSDHASRALMAAGGGASPLRIFLRRDGDAVWAFRRPGATLLRLLGTVAPDGSVTFGAAGGRSESVTLRSRSDGAVEMRSASDGGASTSTTLVADVPWGPRDTPFDSGFALRLGTLSARAQLRREGDKLAGYYRYAKSPDDLALSGTVDAAGRFTLTERTSAGAPTGQWEGTFLDRQAAAGTWSSPDGKRQLPLTMIEDAPLVPLESPDGGVIVAQKETEQPAGHGCTNARSFPVVSGLVPASRNALVNRAIAKLLVGYQSVTCDGTEPNLPYETGVTVRLEAQAPGFVALSISDEENMGGAHPLYGQTCALVDTSTGGVASLLDILGPDARDLMWKDVTSQLHQYWADNSVDPAYLGADAGAPVQDDIVCYVGPHTIEVRYSPYAVAPYMFGGATFSVDVDPLLPRIPKSAARDALFTSRGD
jgi:hypothetical protein